MDITHTKTRFVRTMCIMVILALAFSVAGGASAQETVLPEGSHDGADGIVDSVGCSAFGWAVDPDDPDKDLQVLILVDGSPVATTTADLLREDVGACTGGTCGFSVDLWGLVSAGVEHSITAQAYDDEAAAWIALPGTPKTLTCWGYPEGFHDGNEGLVDAHGCTANGWAAEPDDPDRDLQVRILADGNPVATTTADLLREDLTACTAGTCGYAVDLWGLISPDVEHEILAQAFDEESNQWMNLESTPKSLTCEMPAPHFVVFPYWEWFDGLDWPDGAIVNITVDGKPECSTMKESQDFFFNGSFGDGCNIMAGDVVHFTDGTTTRTHTVRPLRVTGVSAAEDTVAGTADSGDIVYVWPHTTGEQLDVTAAADGTWQVDFTGHFDVVPGAEGRSEVRDEAGNATAVDWHVLNPGFVVFPEWEWFDGIDWPDRAHVNISVANKPECSTSKESQDFFFNGNFGEGCDIVAGDVVTFEDAETIRTHIVQNLSVTEVDILSDSVRGVADPEAVLQVWPHETGEQLQPTADAFGVWQADFTGVFDLLDGSCGRSQIRIEENATAVDWCAPKPWLSAFPENDAVEAWEWPVGSIVTLTIDSAPGLEWNGTAEVTPWGDPRTYIRFDFADAHDLKIGDVVTLTGAEGIVRTHTVQNLSVSKVNAKVDTVSGTAASGALVRIWPHGHDQTATLQVTADVGGAWLANFASVGFNLVPGIGGRSEVHDEAGNVTAVDWNVPVLDWKQLNSSGFGNPLTQGVNALTTFRNRLYAGAGNWETGAEVWRLGSHGEWQKVLDAGFGSGAANPSIGDFIVFQGKLYAGTGWNNENPGQVWRSSDGTHWLPVTTDGFGEPNNVTVTSFAVFKSMLYAGTGSVNGNAQIWRSKNGNSGTWNIVAPDGPGMAGNVTGFGVFKNSLYAAIEPPDGFGAPIQVWRSKNGSDWTIVTMDGFGDLNNESTGGFAQFGGYLYLGTRNETSGAQLWRTPDGVHWKKVVAGGFGDLNNIKIESLVVYNNALYAATYNLSMGLQVWRSKNGIQWTQLVANGFGDSSNFSTLWNSATLKYRGHLLIGTWNQVEGGELWWYTP